MNSSTPVIQDLATLRTTVSAVSTFSISAPLLVDQDFMLGICWSKADSDCAVVHMPLQSVPEVAATLFRDHEKRVYVHALKEVMVWFLSQGVALYAKMFLDISLAAYLLEPPERDLGEDWRKFLLSSLVREYLQEPYPFIYKHVVDSDYPAALYEQLLRDARYVWRLGPILVDEILKDTTLLQPYWELEILLTTVLADMEVRGVGLNRTKMERARPRVRMALDLLCDELASLHGQRFDPWSDDDVRSYLRRTCGVRLGNRDSLDDDLLKGLARSYPAAFKLRTWRRLFRTSEFLEKYTGQDRCHPRWWLTRTAVGRIQCTDPALQSLPKYVRKYLSPGLGNVFIKADYSAFQLRLLAHLSQDRALIGLFQSGRNPHDETQGRLRERGLHITRAQAKTVNFSICYGGTPWSLKDNLGLGFGGLRIAQQIMREMREIYPQLFAYLDGVKDSLVTAPEGERYVRSIRGRRRGFVHDGKLTAREKRQAANAVVQMLEVDVFKKTVLELDKTFRQQALPVQMVLLLHDGIWFTCPNNLDTIKTAKRVIRHVMENTIPLSVPLVVDFE